MILRAVLFFLAMFAGCFASDAILKHSSAAIHRQYNMHYAKDDDNGPYKIKSDRGDDGYIIERSEFDHRYLTLRLHLYRSVSSFEKAAKANGVASTSKIKTKGFTFYNPNSLVCDMYIYDPKYDYEPEFIGHELVHCLYGDFHPNQIAGAR